MSHERADDLDLAFDDAERVGEGSVRLRTPDEASDVFVGTPEGDYEEDGAVASAEGAAGAGGFELPQEGPILFSTEPQTGCANRDRWVLVNGAHIHQDSTVIVTYPFSGDVRTFVADERDECGLEYRDWADLSRIHFRTRQDDGWWLFGHYLVKVVDPAGIESNEVGLVLQPCSESEEDIRPCQ